MDIKSLPVKYYDAAFQIYIDGFYYAAENLMDDEIREYLHSILPPCTKVEFLAAYMVEHENRFGETFRI